MRYLMELFSFDFKHCSPNLIIHKPFFGRVFARYGRAGRFQVAVLFEKIQSDRGQATEFGLTPPYLLLFSMRRGPRFCNYVRNWTQRQHRRWQMSLNGKFSSK